MGAWAVAIGAVVSIVSYKIYIRQRSATAIFPEWLLYANTTSHSLTHSLTLFSYTFSTQQHRRYGTTMIIKIIHPKVFQKKSKNRGIQQRKRLLLIRRSNQTILML